MVVRRSYVLRRIREMFELINSGKLLPQVLQLLAVFRSEKHPDIKASGPTIYTTYMAARVLTIYPTI